MSESPAAGKTAIIVAVIGVIGVVLGSLINGYMQRPRSEIAEQAVPAETSATEPAQGADASAQLVGVRIGRVGPSGHVLTHTTHFAPEDEVAITLRLVAQPRVVQFPARVNAILFGGLHMYRADDSADVSMPGAQQLTLRFPPSEFRSDPLFLSVEMDGMKVFSQEISIIGSD